VALHGPGELDGGPGAFGFSGLLILDPRRGVVAEVMLQLRLVQRLALVGLILGPGRPSRSCDRSGRADQGQAQSQGSQCPVGSTYSAWSAASASANGGRKTRSVPVSGSNSLRCWVTMSVP
jgi:hypothetical protein